MPAAAPSRKGLWRRSSGLYAFADEFVDAGIDLTRWLLTDTYQTTEILLNPGFETAGAGGADVFANWGEAAGGGSITAETVITHGGGQAAKVTYVSGASPQLSQNVNVIPGFTYTFAFWTRGDGVNAGRYGFYDLTHGVNILGGVTTGVTAAVWTQVTAQVTAPPGCVSLQVNLFSASVATSVYYDDASLLPTTGLLKEQAGWDTPEMLFNGGFEALGAGGADPFNGWTEVAGGGGGAATDETVLTHGGGHALKLTYVSGGSNQVSQQIAVMPGYSYTFSFWARGSGSIAGRYSVVDATHGSAAISGVVSTGVTAAAYSQVSYTFVVPAGCLLVQLNFFDAAAAGSVYFDDASFKLVAPAATGFLLFAGGKAVNAIGDPGVIGRVPIARVPGRTLDWPLVVQTVGSGNPHNDWGLTAQSTQPTAVAQMAYGIRVASAGVMLVIDNGIQGGTITTLVPGVQYLLRIVLKDVGALIYLSGGVFGTLGVTFSLVWDSVTGNQGTLYPFMGSQSANMVSDYVRMPLLALPQPVGQDGFGGADTAGPLTVLDTGQAWVMGNAGDAATLPIFGRTGGAMSSSNAGTQNDPHVWAEFGFADGMLSADITVETAASAGVVGFLFRRVDASNYFLLKLNNAADTLTILRNLAGVRSTVGSVSLAMADGQVVRTKLMLLGSTIMAITNEVARLTITDANLVAATKHGGHFTLAGGAGRLDNFTARGPLAA